MYIGGGSYGKVDMYYNMRDEKICAVKYFLQKNTNSLTLRLQAMLNNEKPKKQYNKKHRKNELN